MSGIIKITTAALSNLLFFDLSWEIKDVIFNKQTNILELKVEGKDVPTKFIMVGSRGTLNLVPKII